MDEDYPTPAALDQANHSSRQMGPIVHATDILGAQTRYILTRLMRLGVPVALVINWSLFTFVSWASFHLALLVPTAVQLKVQTKPFKIVSRLVLGICVTSYWVSGLFLFAPSLLNAWLFRFLVVAAFAIVFRILFHLRNNFADDPCADCALGAYPICEWNLPRLLNENDDADIVQALQNSRLSRQLEK